MQVTVGQRLASTVCDTEVIVLRVEGGEPDLSCGGAPMTAVGSAEAHAGSETAGEGDGTLPGKRYVDTDARLELLCTKGGAGRLALGGVPMTVKSAKALPSSD